MDPDRVDARSAGGPAGFTFTQSLPPGIRTAQLCRHLQSTSQDQDGEAESSSLADVSITRKVYT